jgi:hypothetical protein
MAIELKGHLELVDGVNNLVVMHLESTGIGRNGDIVINSKDNPQFIHALLTKVFDYTQKEYNDMSYEKITHNRASKHKVHIIIE